MLGNDYSKKRRLFLRTHLWHHRKHWLPLKGMSYRQMVRSICRYEDTPQTCAKPWSRPNLPPGIVPTLFLFADSARWWMERMAKTPRPLEERLTLFWHRHFATGGQKVFSPGLMMQQNQTLRTHAGGKFEDLLRAVLFDPAMAQYLDLADNTKDQPNENFARELLELFTLGRGHYSERDIQALAGFLTGWKTTLPSLKLKVEGKEELRGPFRFLDLKGQYRLDEVVHYLANHPQTARCLVNKLWNEFAGNEELSPQAEARLISRWKTSQGHILAVLETLFLEPAFQDPKEPRLKSPLEYFLSCQSLLDQPETSLSQVQRLFQLGECPFFPPGVKGWPQQTAWISPTTLMDRWQLAQNLVQELPDEHTLLQLLKSTPQPRRALAHLGVSRCRDTRLGISSGSVGLFVSPPPLSDELERTYP